MAKLEHAVSSLGWKTSVKFKFANTDTNNLEDFFVLFFVDILVNKELPQKEFIFTQIEAINKLNNMPYELKKKFWDTFWNESDEKIDTLVKEIYNAVSSET